MPIRLLRTEPANPIPPLPAAEEGPADWSLLVTDGHVLGHRLMTVARRLFPLSLALAAASIVSGRWALSPRLTQPAALPPSLAQSLLADPARYAHVPGEPDLQDYRLAWLAGVVGEPQRGLTEAGWSAFQQAAITDLNRHGSVASAYEAILKVQPEPLIAPTAKFGATAKELGTGVLLLDAIEEAPTATPGSPSGPRSSGRPSASSAASRTSRSGGGRSRPSTSRRRRRRNASASRRHSLKSNSPTASGSSRRRSSASSRRRRMPRRRRWKLAARQCTTAPGLPTLPTGGSGADTAAPAGASAGCGAAAG